MTAYPNAVSNDEVMAQMLREDPEFARECLSVALEEGDMQDMLILMRQLALAHGGIAELARRAGLNEKSLHRTLSTRGNPQFATMLALFKALGLHMSVSYARPAA